MRTFIKSEVYFVDELDLKYIPDLGLCLLDEMNLDFPKFLFNLN